MYFFILKKVRDRNAADDILQNTFLKIHKNLPKLKDSSKLRAWSFQIARNEIVNYHKNDFVYTHRINDTEIVVEDYRNFCCFDRFINDLPEKYKQVIELVYMKGEKQKDAASLLGISLENVKVRIKRTKDILKKNFSECCKYQFDRQGNLTGETNCPVCDY